MGFRAVLGTWHRPCPALKPQQPQPRRARTRWPAPPAWTNSAARWAPSEPSNAASKNRRGGQPAKRDLSRRAAQGARQGRNEARLDGRRRAGVAIALVWDEAGQQSQADVLQMVGAVQDSAARHGPRTGAERLAGRVRIQRAHISKAKHDGDGRDLPLLPLEAGAQQLDQPRHGVGAADRNCEGACVPQCLWAAGCKRRVHRRAKHARRTKRRVAVRPQQQCGERRGGRGIGQQRCSNGRPARGKVGVREAVEGNICHTLGRRAQQPDDVRQRAIRDQALRARRRFRQTRKKPQQADGPGITRRGPPEQLSKRTNGARVDGGRGGRRHSAAEHRCQRRGRLMRDGVVGVAQKRHQRRHHGDVLRPALGESAHKERRGAATDTSCAQALDHGLQRPQAHERVPQLAPRRGGTVFDQASCSADRRLQDGAAGVAAADRRRERRDDACVGHERRAVLGAAGEVPQRRDGVGRATLLRRRGPCRRAARKGIEKRRRRARVLH
jgi:hypothetical protein